MTNWQLVRDVLLVALLVASVVDDLRRRRISNWLTLPALVVALALALLVGGWGGVTHGLAGALTGAAVAGGLFVVLWLTTGGIGGGDAKLMTAVGALVGFPAALGVLLFVSVAGGVQGVLAFVASRDAAKRWLARLGVPGTDDPAFGRKVRYGLAIAAGTVGFRLWLACTPAEPPPPHDLPAATSAPQIVQPGHMAGKVW